MGFWPFGRDPADIEIVSRVITAAAQNGYRLRGKLTIHFAEPQRQAEADDAGDRCAALAVALLREAPDHERIIGAEAQLSADLTARYPAAAARARAVELAALHVLGDPTLSDELRRASGSGTMPMVNASLSGVSSGPVSSSSRPPAPSTPSTPSTPPAPPGGRSSAPPAPLTPVGSWPGSKSSYPAAGQNTPSAPPVRRRGSSQIRAIQSLLMPPGTSPAAMGQFVAPTVRDVATRLLIGFLRAHDLIGVRRITVDEDSAELLANLVPASDAPPGGYENSRAGEISRWQATLGQGPMVALQREVRVQSAYLAREALARVEVMPELAEPVIESVCAAAFPEEPGLLAELTRLPATVPADFVNQLAAMLTRVAGTGDDQVAMVAALTPLLANLQEDLGLSAMIIKASSGG